MGDLISRSALLDSLKKSKDGLQKIYEGLQSESELDICSGQIVTFIEAILRVKEAPAVDAVEVVRCKDCQNRTQSGGMVLHCSLNGIEVDDDDFCSYGERVKKDAVD